MDVRSNVATVGHNNPPPTPYELSKKAIEDFWDETMLACDGEPITTEGQAEYANNLKRLIQAAAKEADERRKAEAKGFDDGKAEVQARYNPLIQKDNGKTDKAVKAINAWLQPWLLKLAAEQEAAAAAARAEADAARQTAIQAHQIADPTNLAEREAAEALIDAASKAQAVAKRAEKATATVSGGMGRASGLRTSYRADVTDYTEFARHVWKTRAMDMREWLDDFAQQLVARGMRDLPGVTVHEERKVV